MASTQRAATYSRFSTELQSERSIEDQQALCRDYAARHDMVVVMEFADRARSGGSVIGRDGLLNMVDAARENKFDVLVVEALDRISRDMEDLAAIHKRLTFAGIDIIAVHDGVADTVTVGLRGLVGQLYREDNARKVRRGMSGVIRDGRHAGGRSYGYRPVLGEPGRLEIVESEAVVVRRIFDLYQQGNSPRTIAGILNREGVRPPRGARWNASTINGNVKRGNGIIQNPIYQGRLIWNRVKMIRDPATGKRISRVNPEAEWQSAEVPHLRIVGEAAAAAVTARKATNVYVKPKPGPKPKRHLLSGLLSCGACGGGMSVAGSNRGGQRIQCSTYIESRSCKNNRRYQLDRIERTVIGGLRKALSDPALVDSFLKAYREERRDIEAKARRERGQIDTSLQDVNAAIARLVAALADGIMEQADVTSRMQDLRAQRDRLNIDLANSVAKTNVVDLYPDALKSFQENLSGLATAADLGSAIPDETVSTFRTLVNRVIVQHTAARENYEVSIDGRLNALIAPQNPIVEAWADLLVAEDRAGLNRRTQVVDIIHLGSWREAMIRAIADLDFD
ncbi:recombinase family protein [Chelatococcus asaccharovorans]|uniref:recombinase family protein n=1 Tax=Chelatococcus asaccharovorans TaxID=28210 RepID=UPI0022646878|nr:recombinase family protein [Chelatococcus asaccharovorans]